MQIRIVKRNCNNKVAPAPKKQNRQRKIALAVENWIADVRQKHAEESRIAFDQLFSGGLPASKLS